MAGPHHLVYLPGNNYRQELVRPFLDYISPLFSSVTYVELLENMCSDLAYEQLVPEAYNHYILNQLPDTDQRYVFLGTSMGCYHIQNFAAEFPNLVSHVIWIEPTMCGGDYGMLRQFESGRGNGEWIDDFRRVETNIEGLPSADKVIDIAVSREGGMAHFDRSIPVGVIYTTRNVNDEPYNGAQLLAKNSFLDTLRNEGYSVTIEYIDSVHAADTNPDAFAPIAEFVYSCLCAAS